jgi:hypothetical protein
LTFADGGFLAPRLIFPASLTNNMSAAAADPEIILETYDKHHVKVPTSIAKRSNTINLMIEGDHAPFVFFPSACYGGGVFAHGLSLLPKRVDV